MAKQPSASARPGLVDRIQLAVSTCRSIDGLWVGSWRTPSNLRRVEDALLLIKQYSPLQYSRVVRNLSRVWVGVLTHAGAEYKHSLNACMLDERYIANSTPERLASTIVHEATHARLERCGIRYEENLRSRIEALCLRRELAFARKLPNGSQLQDELLHSLEWCGANAEWFLDAKLRQRYEEGAVEALRYVDTPEWLIRFAAIARPVIFRMRRLLSNLT